MDYPFEESFREGKWQGIIRLKVAALCACIDNARTDGETSSALEEELECFFKPTETVDPNGSAHTSQLDPHSFLYIEPEGNLAGDVDDVIGALIASVRTGELATASIRVALDGTINPIDTWIYCSDFRKWCKSRGISLDEVYDEYVDSEWEIYAHGEANAHDMRLASESPLFDAEYLKIRRPAFDSYEGLQQRYEELFLKNFLGMNGYAYTGPTAAAPAEHPVSPTERNTLLVIIEALCRKCGIDSSNLHAASTISALVDEIPASIRAETIRKKLDLIPDAIGRRMLPVRLVGKK